MPVDVADLERRWSARTIDVARNAVLAPRFCSRTYQPEITAGAYEVKVPVRANTVTVTARTRGADWKTPQETDTNLLSLTMDQQAEASNKMRYEDVREMPGHTVSGLADDQGDAIAQYIDKNLWDFFAAQAHADNIYTVGTSANYVDADGDNSVDAAADLVYELIEDISLNASKEALSGATSANPLQVWATLPPALFRNLRRYLLDKNWGDRLSTEAFRSVRVGLPTGRASGQVANVILFQSNNIPTAEVDESGTDKTHAQIIAGAGTRGVTFANVPILTQILTPRTNQSGPHWRSNQAIDFGRLATDKKAIWVGRVRQEA